MDPISFATSPETYRHWKLSVDGEIATLTMHVDDDHPLRTGYELKLNSYDLSVDIELSDAVQRIRFEHPEVKTVVISADIDRVFCSGANIYMLGASTHSFKINFCKFTNETRLYMEDASRNSGITFLAACNGATAGGGYELALACDDIVLIDDGSSSVSFPETPLLAVLPGTGGLTRLVDKRKVRRDRADVFCTLAEGIKGKKAVEWGLVDAVIPRSKFADGVKERAQALASKSKRLKGPAVKLQPLTPTRKGDTLTYNHVELAMKPSERTASLTISAPENKPPTDAAGIGKEGSAYWGLRAFRELDDALLELRFNYPEIGTVLIHTNGQAQHVLSVDEALEANQNDGFCKEVRLLQARVLRALDVTARSFFAVAETGSCFVGSLLEVALASDRFYMLEDDDGKVSVQCSIANHGALPVGNGLSRMAMRFYGDDEGLSKALSQSSESPVSSAEAEAIGIATLALDDIDFEDELRIAVEERVSLSPDALTGMEASLRFVGPETLETKIFGRLSAWQNWIFTRPNATGKSGALSLYGKPERPAFNWNRT